MKKYLPIILIVSMIAGCKNNDEMIIDSAEKAKPFCIIAEQAEKDKLMFTKTIEVCAESAKYHSNSIMFDDCVDTAKLAFPSITKANLEYDNILQSIENGYCVGVAHLVARSQDTYTTKYIQSNKIEE